MFKKFLKILIARKKFFLPKKNKEIVLEAAKQDGYALQFVDESLKKVLEPAI